MSTGLDSFLGVSAETTYGTFVAPTDFYEFDSETLARRDQYVTPSGLKNGRLARPVDRHKKTVRDAGGDLNLKVPNKGFGLLLDMLHGNVVTPAQQAATAAYLQTHNIGTTRPDSKYRTIQINKPQAGGSDQAHSYVGSKITQAVFSCEQGSELSCALTVDARDEDLAQTLATPSYPSDIAPRLFNECEVTIAAATPALFKSFTLTIPIPMDVGRWGLSRSALKAKPLVNDYITPTLNLTAEYEDDTLYAHFLNDDEVATVIDFEGPEIDSGELERFTITAGACKITGATPPVNGPGILMIETPIEIFDAGSGFPLVIEYQSTDTSL